MYHDKKYILPSDDSLRTDLKCPIKKKENINQKEKERLEARQGEDINLRLEWA